MVTRSFLPYIFPDISDFFRFFKFPAGQYLGTSETMHTAMRNNTIFLALEILEINCQTWAHLKLLDLVRHVYTIDRCEHQDKGSYTS